MMNSKNLVFGILLIFLIGCSGVGTPKEKSVLTDTSHIGVKGVTMSFIKNNPPDVSYTGTPLTAVIELKNEGAAEVVGGTLYLSGYDSNIFNMAPQYQTFDLEAKSKFNTFGGYDTKEFTSGNIYLPRGTDVLDQKFLASACYQYRTTASIPVCIDPDPIAILENEACKVTNPLVSGGQGAPVAVTAVQENAQPGQVGFLLTISNLGDGQVIEQNSLGRCPGELKFNDIDAISYNVKMSNAVATCNPASKVRLSNKQGNLYCTFQLNDASSPAYTSVLEVTLNYGYLSQISKTVKVKSIN